MKNKLVLISIIGFIILFIYQKIDYEVHSYIIDNMYINFDNKNINDYIGYIEIPELKIKREIVLGINDINLLTHITVNEDIKSLEDEHIILAGHSVNNLFGNLHKAKKNQLIYININGKKNIYYIDEILNVNKENTDILEQGELILITCIDNERRLIIKAKRI